MPLGLDGDGRKVGQHLVTKSETRPWDVLFSVFPCSSGPNSGTQ